MVRRLEREDDRSGFKSGKADLDRFFLHHAAQEQFLQQIGTTYVAVGDANRILGYATVIPSEIAGPPRSKQSPLPVLRLVRLAVDRRARGKGVGRQLLRATVDLALRIGQSVGCEGLVVDATADAVPFYESLAFIPLEATAGQLGGRLMFLELGSVPY